MMNQRQREATAKRIERAIATINEILADSWHDLCFDQRCKLRDGKSALTNIGIKLHMEGDK